MAQVGNAHRRSRLLRGVGRVVPTRAVLQTDRASVQVCATVAGIIADDKVWALPVLVAAAVVGL